MWLFSVENQILAFSCFQNFVLEAGLHFKV